MARVKCPRCSTVNPEGRVVCVECGGPLPKIRLEVNPPSSNKQGPGPSRQEAQFRRAEIVANRYTVIDVIGRGGMGCIYRAYDNTLKEEIALKTLLPQFMRDKVVLERFFNEARIARSLSHPNIVRVHDIGRAGQHIYISMEYLEGKSLRAVLDELSPGRRLPIARTLRVVDDLCAALEYAHRFTIHRDIKPENIMIREDGAVKLMDFGISKLMTNANMTATSVIMGTPYYMSPEQLRDSSRVDVRSDIYSVGVVLYEILTGSVPTGIPKPASQLVREVPPALDPIVAKCVEPEPGKRYQTIPELRQALREVRELVAANGGMAAGARFGGRAGLLRRIAGLVLVVMVLAGAGFGVHVSENHRREMLAAYEARMAEAQRGAGEESFATRFDKLATLIDAARAHAVEAAEPADGNTDAASEYATLGESYRRQALLHAKQENPLAFVWGRWALECFLAPFVAPDGMVFIPPGEVIMGGAPVAVDGFFIDATEVTNERYHAFCRDAPWPLPVYAHFDYAAPDLPVTTVTFYDAQAYAAWNGKKAPTEAQWARAAYGVAYGVEGEAHLYPWGDTWDGGRANWQTPDGYYQAPEPPRTFEDDCTARGCYDMAGNVAEWTRSLFRPLPYVPTDGREDPARIYFGANLALRGGDYTTQSVPLDTRRYIEYDACSPAVGFRCVWEFPSDVAGLAALVNRIGFQSVADGESF